MLEQENTPESKARIENLNELMNAAAEAVERGETVRRFSGSCRAGGAMPTPWTSASQVTLLTMHNAKGLEFPVVFLAGLEEGLFPHSRSFDSEAMMEEERRLCYVGMTRAEKRLILSWARYRRRFGGGEQERSIPSRFLSEVPSNLIVNLGGDDDAVPTGRFDRGAIGGPRHRQEESVHRQNLQLAGKHFAVLRRARRRVSSASQPSAQTAARQPQFAQGASAAQEARTNRHDRRASQVRHRHRAPARRRGR